MSQAIPGTPRPSGGKTSEASPARPDAGEAHAIAHDHAAGHGRAPLLPLALGALGVVYGDIGTSPLYALRECFLGEHALDITPDNVLGVLSLIFWALTINVVLNIAWSGIFFKMRRPDWALGEVALLWASVLSLILVLGSASTWAGLLLLPYLLWVSTASFLNLRIVQMNRPFG